MANVKLLKCEWCYYVSRHEWRLDVASQIGTNIAKVGFKFIDIVLFQICL